MNYRTIVVDPPWKYDGFVPSQWKGQQWHRPLPYPMMELDEIAALPVAALAEHDCRLFLWATDKYVGDAHGILAGWGFQYRQTLVWRKTGNVLPFGGSIAPIHAEFVLVGTRGQPKLLNKLPSSVIDGPKPADAGGHSRKPDVFLDLIEQASPGPYVELFARRARFGWDYWGDESLGTAELVTSYDAETWGPPRDEQWVRDHARDLGPKVDE